jgi:hypothetical protein
MTTAVQEKPATTKRKVPQHIKAAADAAEQRSKGLPLDKPKVRARGRREAVVLTPVPSEASALPPLEEITKKQAKAAPVKAKQAKAAPKAKEPKEHPVTAMWVIRTNMAEAIATNGKPATVEMISKACEAAGVPKAEGTIRTIVSDFMQTYLAMQQAGLVKALKD